MREFDLDKIWQESEVQAQQHYQEVEGVIIEMAIRQSQNVLHKVEQIATWELVFGCILMTIVCFLFWPQPIIFWTSLVSFILLFGFAWRNLIRLKADIKKVLTYDTQKAINQYISILEAHQNRINKYLIVATPLTFLAGLFSGIITQDYGSWQLALNWHMLKWLAFSIASISILILLVRKAYLPWSVGRHVAELRGMGGDKRKM